MQMYFRKFSRNNTYVSIPGKLSQIQLHEWLFSNPCGKVLIIFGISWSLDLRVQHIYIYLFVVPTTCLQRREYFYLCCITKFWRQEGEFLFLGEYPRTQQPNPGEDMGEVPKISSNGFFLRWGSAQTSILTNHINGLLNNKKMHPT